MKTFITNMSLGELLAAATENARKASNAIDELLESYLEKDETPHERALRVCRQAKVLAEAWQIVDSIMQTEADPEPCDCPSCSPEASEGPATDTSNMN